MKAVTDDTNTIQAATTMEYHPRPPDPSAAHGRAPACARGYADKVPSADTNATFAMDSAVNSSGTPVSLTAIDFIKLQPGTTQEAGWLGEVSTEIAGIEDINL